MLTLRTDQMEVHERRLFKAMHRRVEQVIAVTCPEVVDAPRQPGSTGPEVGAASGLESTVSRGIESAVAFGLGDGPDIAAFIALGLALRASPPGESGSWVNRYLNRRDASGPTKLAMIESRLESLCAKDPAWAAIAGRVAQARHEMSA